MQKYKEKEYRRFPIQLNKHTIMLIHLFNRHDCLEDIWMDECDHKFKEDVSVHKEAAQQLMYQLEDYWTPAFLMALKDEITEELQCHDEEFGTNFSKGETK